MKSVWYICPEMAVNSPIPRPPVEIVVGDGKAILNGQAKVIESTGNDVTNRFVEGVQKALKFAKEEKIKIAILTDGSPSCGSTFIYDGNFTDNTVPGKGVTSEILEKNGVRIFSENHINDALEYLENIDLNKTKVKK